jgi:hypothetical protein
MAVIKKESETTVETSKEKKPKVELTHTLLGTYRNEKSGRHHLVVLKYNPETEDLGPLEIVEMDSKAETDSKFRMEAVRSGNIG